MVLLFPLFLGENQEALQQYNLQHDIDDVATVALVKMLLLLVVAIAKGN